MFLKTEECCQTHINDSLLIRTFLPLNINTVKKDFIPFISILTKEHISSHQPQMRGNTPISTTTNKETFRKKRGKEHLTSLTEIAKKITI